MLYEAAAGATFILCASTIFAQLAFIPLIWRSAQNIENNLQQRIDSFLIVSERAHIQLNSMRQHVHRPRRSLKVCEPYEQGPPGPPGDDGEDGITGLNGPDGSRGLDARDMMREMGDKCIICPRGPVGPTGAPGNQGLRGLKGDKGFSGTAGRDGRDGDIGAEGPLGFNGTAGRTGKRGSPGRSAPGGTGASGPKGLVGPIGRTGQQGERGKRNFVYGPSGPDGKAGVNGMDGLVGSFGRRGEKGPVGEPGANAKFCPCAMELIMAKKKEHDKESEHDLPGKLNSGEARPAGPPGENVNPPGPAVSTRIGSDAIGAEKEHERVSEPERTVSHHVHKLFDTPTDDTFDDTPLNSASRPETPAPVPSVHSDSRFYPVASDSPVQSDSNPSSRAQIPPIDAVDLPVLPVLQSLRNAPPVSSEILKVLTKHPESSSRSTLSHQRQASTTEVKQGDPQYPLPKLSHRHPEIPIARDLLSTARPMHDPVQSYPAKEVNDIEGRPFIKPVSTSTIRPLEKKTPSHIHSHSQTSVNKNLAARLKTLFSRHETDAVSRGVQKETWRDFAGESVLFPDPIVSDYPADDLILSDETRHFFRAGLIEDSNRRTTTLETVPDVGRTSEEIAQDSNGVTDSIGKKDQHGSLEKNPNLGDEEGVTAATPSTAETPGEIITAYYEETAAPTRRRFQYVTKKPRKYTK